MTDITFLATGLVLGGIVAWLWAIARTRASLAGQITDLERRAHAAERVTAELRPRIERLETELEQKRSSLGEERRSRAETETRLEAAQGNLEEQRKQLDEATQKLTDTFKALSSDALRSNNQSFLELARQSLQTLLEEAKGDLGKRQKAIDGLVSPLQDTLKRYEEQIKAMEESRQKAYGSLEEQLRSLTTTQQELQRETGQLATALSTPQVRGRWGEVTLHRVVELAGMSEHCDYVEQTTVDTETGRLRPDMIVRLPADREIVIDAKVSLDGYLEAVSAPTEDERRAALARHAQHVRAHMHELAAKSYWKQFSKTPEIVVMFIPGESFFAAAADTDPKIIEDGMSRRIVLATPTTLIALLRAVAYGWRQERIAENAQAISSRGRQLYDRLRTLAEHLTDIGKSLDRAVTSYNRAVGSIETRVYPAARRFKELGAATGDDIPVLEGVDQAPRPLSSPKPEEELT